MFLSRFLPTWAPGPYSFQALLGQGQHGLMAHVGNKPIMDLESLGLGAWAHMGLGTMGTYTDVYTHIHAYTYT